MAGVSMGFTYAPNQLVRDDLYTTDTKWHVVAMDGTGYTTLALLLAAGKTPYPFGNSTTPGLDPGHFLQGLIVRSMVAGTGADGSAFYIAVSRGAAFSSLASEALRDQQSLLVSGGGQMFGYDGGLWNVWVRKTVASDEIILQGSY